MNSFHGIYDTFLVNQLGNLISRLRNIPLIPENNELKEEEWKKNNNQDYELKIENSDLHCIINF